MPLQPMPLQKRRLPFDDANFLFELKYDGFRALAVAERQHELISRNGHPFGSFADLAKDIAEHLPRNTVIDGEIVVVDRRGKPRFNDLLFHRRPPCFFAFDLLILEGRDYRAHQLLERKQELRRLLAPVRRTNARCGTLTTLTAMESRYSSECASSTWKALWPSTNMPLTWKIVSRALG